MSQSDDLSKLFQRFGGKTESYQEIVREDAATQARERWPLLSAVRVDRAATVPSVQPAPHGFEAAAPQGVAPEPLWRGAQPVSQPPAEPVAIAMVPPSVAFAAPATAPAAPPASAMAPRFRTPEGMPPAPPAAPARAVASAVSPASSLPVSGPMSAPAPHQASIWAPATPSTELAGHAASTELSQVFARLEGRPEPVTTSERVPARRSFLDRLKRS